MSTPRGSLPYTREACLRVLGLGLEDGAPEKIAHAYRESLKLYHPDVGGRDACKVKLNQVVHARNMLSSGAFAGGGSGLGGGGYGNQWGGYGAGTRADPHGYSAAHPERDPLGLYRFRSLGARRFAGNVRLGMLLALFATGGTLAYARSTADRRKKERSPRLRALMGLRRD